MLLQPLCKTLPHPNNPHDLALLGVIVTLDRLTHIRNGERMALDGPDGWERKEEMLTGLPAHAVRPRPADVQGNMERPAHGDTDSVLGEELDTSGRLVRGVEVAEDEVADVPAGAVLGPDRNTGPHVLGPATRNGELSYHQLYFNTGGRTLHAHQWYAKRHRSKTAYRTHEHARQL